MNPFSYQLFLKSIQYSGDNIGKDWEFSIRAAGVWTKFSLKLSVGEEEIFEEKLLVEKELKRTEGTFRFNLKIDAVEKDPKIDDEKQHHSEKIFEITPNTVYPFIEKITVREDGNKKKTKRKAAILTFNFETKISELETEIPDTFPFVAPPAPSFRNLGKRTFFNCDPECLSHCGISIPCIINCCNKY